MEANESAVIISNTTNPGTEKYLHKALEVSFELDTTLAGFSDKLADLENRLSRLLAADENHIVANAFENEDISIELIEKIFMFDLLCTIINFNLRELDDSMGGLEDVTVDALCKVSSCENSTELVTGLVHRLHDSEGLLKRSRERILEMKIQFTKLQMNSFSSVQHDFGCPSYGYCDMKGIRRLQDFTNQLCAKEEAFGKLNSDIACLDADNAEVKILSSKAQKLEENLKITESKLEEANASNEKIREWVMKTEFEIVALREKTHAAESRAESAEEKTMHLNELNLELSEEVYFFKGINDSTTKKVSVLEKQLRELDSELQYWRASSKASQEQQMKLYEAIWDMEKLIDELKQKAESKTKSVEERCIISSETNSDIDKKLMVLRSRVEHLENSLNRAALEKKLCAEDISIRSSRIMETVLRLAVERERVQKQLISCAKENKLMRERLRKVQEDKSVILVSNRSCDQKKCQLSRLQSADSDSTEAIAVKATEILSESPQVEKLSEDVIPDDSERGASRVQLKSARLVENGNYWRTFISMTILVVILSSLAAHFFQKKLAIL